MTDPKPQSVTTVTSPTPSLPEFGERRREPRFPCDAIPARVRTDLGLLPAHVMDIARSGVRLEVATSLLLSSEVTLFFNDIVAAGEIRYCRRNPTGSFDVGIQLQDLITDPGQTSATG
jgi:hypothetical protein